MQDVKIYNSARKLKSEEVDLVNVQEMHNVYNYDDFGYITLHANSNQWYKISFTHKIAADSHLFAGCRLPTTLYMRGVDVQYKLWVINGTKFTRQDFVVVADTEPIFTGREASESRVDCYTVKSDHKWEDDIKIHTTNWDSSDDEDLASDCEADA